MALLWGGVIVLGYAFVVVWPVLTAFERSCSLPFVAAACALFLWVGYGTYYYLEGETLVIRSGPVRLRVELSEIEEVVASRSPLSAPACSLDRLHIRTRKAPGVLISPDDKIGFLRELTIAAPWLRLEEERVIRVDV